jgi:hypothetical protein
MKAQWVSKNAGTWSITVGFSEVLHAPSDPETGELMHWLPCSHCGDLCRAKMNVIATVCSDDCKAALDNPITCDIAEKFEGVCGTTCRCERK